MKNAKRSKYGMRHYCLINSGPHLLSVLPLSGPLSIAGSNNAGKSSAIQSMQYLLFNNQSHMDFGNHDAKASREFYFPKDNSFVMMEVMLSTGIFIIGAHGKGAGAGYDYELFVARGELNTDDFLDDNRLLSYREVFSRWSTAGREYMSVSREEMRQLLYGEYVKVRGGNWNITLAPIANAGERRYGVFRQIYKNLLTQSVLKSKEFKELILNVFSDKLSNSSINFTQVRKEAFRDHALLAHEIQSLEQRRQDILTLFQEQQTLQDKSAEGALLTRQLKVNVETAAMAYPELLRKWEAELLEKQESKSLLNQGYKTQHETLTQLHRQKGVHDAMAKEIVALKQRTSLGSQAETEASLQAVQRDIAGLEASLAQAGVFQPDVIERKLRSVEAQIKTLTDKHTRLKDGDGLAHSLGLSEGQISEASRLLNPQLFGLSKHCLKEATKGNFKNYLLAHLTPEDGLLERAGFSLNAQGIAPVTFELDQLPELEQQIQLERNNLQALQKDLAIANDQEGTRLRLAELKQTARKLSSSVHDYERLGQLEGEYLDQKGEIVSLELKIEELTEATDQYAVKLEALNTAIQSIGVNLEGLRRKQKTVREVQEKLSYKIDFFGLAEGDDEAFLCDLSEFDFDEVLARLNSLEMAVRSIQNNAKVCQERIIESLPQLAEHLEDNSLAIKAKERIDALPQTREWLARLQEAAIIKVAGSLRDLQDNYLQLEHEITLFNRSIGARKVSNLKRFSIELRRNDQILESIDTLLQHMNSSDFSADLFGGAGEEISNAELKRAIERISRVVENGKDGNLEVADLFEMAFTVVDARGRETTSETLDDMASTGSSIALKILVLAALLRHLMDKKARGDEPFLPFYLDEAERVDEQNQKVILGYAQDMGLTPVFASVHPTLTGDYGVNLSECIQDDSRIVILPADWQHFVHHDQVVADNQLELPA